MSDTTELVATPREVIGKANRRLKGAGQIPAVVYGAGRGSMAIALDRHEFELYMQHHGSGSALVSLKIEGESEPVDAIIKDMQMSPVKGSVLHIDFLAIKMDEVIASTAAIHYVGDAPGVKEGGVLLHDLREFAVEALPKDLPDFIEVDVSGLELNLLLSFGFDLYLAGWLDRVFIIFHKDDEAFEDAGGLRQDVPQKMGEKMQRPPKEGFTRKIQQNERFKEQPLMRPQELGGVTSMQQGKQLIIRSNQTLDQLQNNKKNDPPACIGKISEETEQQATARLANNHKEEALSNNDDSLSSSDNYESSSDFRTGSGSTCSSISEVCREGQGSEIAFSKIPLDPDGFRASGYSSD